VVQLTRELHQFSSLFSRTAWLSRCQNAWWNPSGFNWGKRWWGLASQYHQLDHIQTIFTLLQTDNHTSTSSLDFYRLDALRDTRPSVRALKAVNKRTKSLKVLNIFEDSPIFCTSGTLWLSQDSSLKPIRDAGNVFSNRYTWRTCWLDYLKYSELPKKYDDNWQLEGHKCRLIVIFVIVAEFVLKLSWAGMPWHRGLWKTP